MVALACKAIFFAKIRSSVMNDPILFWNSVANENNRVDHTAPMTGVQGGPTRSSRATAIAHLAMHDAYFGVAGGQALYLAANAPSYAGGNGAKEASSAVTGAAQTVLASLYPNQRDFIDGKALEIAGINETDGDAFEFGRLVAMRLLALRSADGSSAPAPAYVYSSAKPRHRADPLNAQLEPLGSSWGRVAPFAVQSFHPLATYPAFKSGDYDADHEEVRLKGGSASQAATTRTTQETTIGLYWAYDGATQLGTPPRLYNQIVREIAIGKGNSVADNARLLALVNVAMGDAGIQAWYWKYHYDLWRPIIGIREYDNNWGPDAIGGQAVSPKADPYWRPLGAPKTNDTQPGARSFTPPFPAYPSGHATFGAAAFEMVRLFYGHANEETADNIGFTFVSDELNGISRDNDGALRTRHERKFASVADAIFENSISRIYLGVHWRFDGTSAKSIKKLLEKSSSTGSDNIGGVPLGRAIARDIFNSGLVLANPAAVPPA
jgi:Vanadium chloroperoxidase N-terminal domain/PAP2 superfamily